MFSNNCVRAFGIAFVAAVGLGTTWAAPAKATVYQIPAPAFTQHCACTIGIGPDTVSNGVLTPDGPGNFFATLPFTGTGNLCQLTMIYRDVNAEQSMNASVVRRNYLIGQPVAASGTTQLALVTSASGTPDTIRSATTTSIANPAINTSTGFYFVRVHFDNINMDLVGVQVDIRPTCPIPG